MPVFPTLNQVRSYKNFGLVFQGNTYDPIFTKGWLLSSPGISIQGATCYIDYSQSFDTSDRIYLKRTFGTFSGGETFYVQPTQYYDPLTNTRSTLGGTCNFNSTLNDGKIIVGTISSGLTYTSSYNFYKKENFVTPVQYTFVTSGSTANNYLLNSLPQSAYTTFKQMGFLGSNLGFQEYIDVSGATSSNLGRLVVQGAATLKDNQEVLYLNSGITAQSLISSSNDVKMYIRGKSSVNEIQQPENVLGIYRIHDNNNKLIDCYENQNYYQTFLRIQGITSSGYNGYWVECETCPDNIYGQTLSADGVSSTILYDNSVYLYIAQIATNAATTFNPTLSYGVYTQRSYTGTPQSAARMTFSISVGLKIDLSHASLQGWKFDVFTDLNCTMPLLNNIYASGDPGFDKSYVLLVNSNDIPRTLYCRFTGLQTISLVINI